MFTLYLIIIISNFGLAQTIHIGQTTLETSAILSIQDTAKGLLLPGVNSNVRMRIANPKNGLLLYQPDRISGVYYYNNAWERLKSYPWIDSTLFTYTKTQVGITANLNLMSSSYSFQIVDDGDFNLNSQGNILLGSMNGKNMVIGGNKIQARNILSSSTLHINKLGGIFSLNNFYVKKKLNIGDNIFPEAKLHIKGGSDVSPSNGGFLQIGSNSTNNLGVDNNEIMARKNGTTSELFIQNDYWNSGFGTNIGGGVEFNEDVILYPLHYYCEDPESYIQLYNSSFLIIETETGSESFTIEDGTYEGQLLIIITPHYSDHITTQSYPFSPTSNMKLIEDEIDLGDNKSLTLIWDGSFWVQINNYD